MSGHLSQGILWEVVQDSESQIFKVTEIIWELMIMQSLNHLVEPELLLFYAVTRSAWVATLRSISWEEAKNKKERAIRATWRGEKPPNPPESLQRSEERK